MSYRVADPSLTQALEAERAQLDAEAAAFHLRLRRPARRATVRPGAGKSAEVLMTMVAVSAPIWCPLATYFASEVGGSSGFEAVLAGVLGFGVGLGLAIAAFCYGAVKSQLTSAPFR
jgi:hypothetical protein